MYTRILKSCVIVALGALAHAALADVASAPATRWHVAMHGSATSDGQMQFRVTPHEGEPLMVNADIKQGRGELFMARDLAEVFKAQLPKKRFKSEVIGSTLLVKAGPGEPDFALELVASSVGGTRVQVSAN